jgi:pilus assembly protein CpaB
VGVTYFFYTKVRNAAKADVKKIVVAAAALPAGTTLSEQNLKLMDWPANVPVEGSAATVAELSGRVLLYPADANEPIRAKNLAGVGSGPGLSAKIPEGMRAIAVRTNEVNNVGGFLYPGARVDVLLTVNTQGGAQTRTVLQDVQILTVGTKSEPNAEGKPEDAKVVTLLATPEDSQKLVLASNHGTLQLVLRGGADSAKVETRPVTTGELMGGPRMEEQQVAAPRRRSAPAAARPQPYTVETITGGKRSVATFEPAPAGGKPKQ